MKILLNRFLHALIACATFAHSAGYASIAAASSAPSSWAATEVSEAVQLGIAPSDLRENYQEGINRMEFAKTAVCTVATIEGITPSELISKTKAASIFDDSKDLYVLCAAALEIIHGRGEGIFDPFSPITREEAAVMLRQTALAIGAEGSNAKMSYADESEISPWALEAVEYVTGNKIMVGVGANSFSPKGGYTREQAFATFLRILKATHPAGGIAFVNRDYGFEIDLPASWRGCTQVTDAWEGYMQEGEGKETGPMLLIRHPQWSKAQERQDIPVMIFTHDQWKRMTVDDSFHIGAAPMNPKELGRNSLYIFGLPARYNYAFLEGSDEVEQILADGGFHTLELINVDLS
ncbi:MAG: S-layer homology domain-containing protein [Clostridiales bacterium]|jgi:hypothetical protein|nr:S-layer homology domain-containing protein [Clostridiales bacterium]